jgi:hypothetical protein
MLRPACRREPAPACAAHCLAADDPRAAKEFRRAAVATLEELGAQRDLDERRSAPPLGVGARIGPRMSGKLTRREEEVLPLPRSA